MCTDYLAYIVNKTKMNLWDDVSKTSKTISFQLSQAEVLLYTSDISIHRQEQKLTAALHTSCGMYQDSDHNTKVHHHLYRFYSIHHEKCHPLPPPPPDQSSPPMINNTSNSIHNLSTIVYFLNIQCRYLQSVLHS